MRTVERTDDRITVTHDDAGWARFFLFAVVVLFGCALFNYGKRPPDMEKVIGSLGGAGVFAAFFLGAYERSVFIFDRRRRVVAWRRRRALSRKRGTLPFDEIKVETTRPEKVLRPSSASSSFLRRPPIRMFDRTIINRPAAVVWPYVIGSDYFRKWNNKIVDIDASGEFHLGQSFGTRYRMGSKEIRCLSTVIAIEDRRLLALRHANCLGEKIRPDLEVVERIILRESKGRTLVRKEVTFRNHDAPWLFIPVIRIVSYFGSPVEPDALKALCEADS